MAGTFSPRSERMSDTTASVHRSGLPAGCGRGVGEGGGGALGPMDILGAEAGGACGTTKGFLHTGQLICWPE